MYLVELDPADGLVLVTGRFDGVRGIKSFRDVLDDKKLGRECMTVIALVVDYESLYRHWGDDDRPLKCSYEVTGNRKKWTWKQEKIQKALIDYKELQYNPDMVEKLQLDQLIIKQLNAIQVETDDARVSLLFKNLNTFKDLKKKWIEENGDKDVLADGPVEGKYHLSRLEEKLRENRSFYNA